MFISSLLGGAVGVQGFVQILSQEIFGISAEIQWLKEILQEN